jgi:hypothetical protein
VAPPLRGKLIATNEKMRDIIEKEIINFILFFLPNLHI